MQTIDMLLRFGSLGQLALFVVILLSRRPVTTKSLLLLALCPCVGGYVLLSAPIDSLNEHYRGVLLVLTHTIPYLVWALAVSVLGERFRPAEWPVAVKALAVALAILHVYYFGILEGRGAVHDLVHAFFLLLFGHLIFMAVGGLRDDLVEPRRRFRFVLLAFVCLQLASITFIELVDPGIAGVPAFSVASAAAIFVLITLVGVHLLLSPRPTLVEDAGPASELKRRAR